MEERFHAFTVLIAGISRSIRRIKTEEMAEFGLKSPHVSCLYYLCKAGPMTAASLCERCGEDKANVSRSLKFLEENGYLTGEKQAGKRPRSLLTLTDKGQTVGERIAARIDRILEQAGEGIDEEERVLLYKNLSRIESNLQRIGRGERE